MTETSFPIVDAKLSDETWGVTVGAAGNGIIDDWGAPYALVVNTNDTVTVKRSYRTGIAQAVVNGFQHQIDADVVLSVPAVTSLTTYQIGLLYDPQNASLPVKLVVLKGDPPTLGDGQEFLPFYVIVRGSGQTLAAAQLFSPKPRRQYRILVAKEGDLDALNASLFPYGTEAYATDLNGTWRAAGSYASGGEWVRNATEGTITPQSGYSVYSGASLRIVEGMVELYLHLTGSFPTHTARVVAKIPSAYAPSGTVLGTAMANGGDFPEAVGISINSSGNVTYYGGSGTHNQLGGFVKFRYSPS
ncbi:hypothetical protein Csp2054_09145 [Curtobacterium sp. 'Ferrero']|uniref:hypothetical protein n=1 Tax=Curtobacterium sp. 'Ferrero' TaxID=2033654 RepID=UPI000BD4BDC2|nr:hypothetical protein [Curtobacterium sp. 'Ferrero']PCN48029.1 hypothetical protein Csp2054_09145 [Curtobacterium sp. 'Ferrero']